MNFIDDTGGIAAILDQGASYHWKLMRVTNSWRKAIAIKNQQRLEILLEKLVADGVNLTLECLQTMDSRETAAMLSHYGVERLTDPATVDFAENPENIEECFRVYFEDERLRCASVEYSRQQLATAVRHFNEDLLDALYDQLTEVGWTVSREKMDHWIRRYTNTMLASHGYGPLLETQMMAGLLVPLRHGTIIKSAQRPEWS